MTPMMLEQGRWSNIFIFFFYFNVFYCFSNKMQIKKNANELKSENFDIADTNYLNIMTNTYEPSQKGVKQTIQRTQ